MKRYEARIMGINASSQKLLGYQRHLLKKNQTPKTKMSA